MQYIRLQGFSLSKIILGTWAIGGTHWGTYDEQAAIKTIETAIELGINTIDTAPVYGNGHAERLIGSIIKSKRESIVIATKCGIDPAAPFRIDLSPKFIRKEIENSLRRLNTEYIDLYQCHWPDTSTPVAKTMEVLNQLKKEGKINHIGVCNFRDNELREATRYAEIVTCQNQYSLLKRDIENRIQKTCIEKNIWILPYGVLGGGVLTGKYSVQPIFEHNDARSIFYPYYSRQAWPRTETIVKALRQEAQQKNCTPAQAAIAWVLHQPAIVAAIVGARTPKQIEEHLQGLSSVAFKKN
ncbi:MAG TPA: aldo/keto reductase [Chitinispirillaceae bacterium]|nr:aldo/keto reductase [Chitinispirillaceae bacterium]